MPGPNVQMPGPLSEVFDLERDENGVPVLQRAEFQNNGIWQLGSKITGRVSWEDAA